MIFVANYKMNGDKNFYIKVNKIFSKFKSLDTIVLCPPFVYTPFLKLKNVALGVQNVAAQENKQSTGEISARMLADLGAKYAIIGHSERREMGEIDEMVALKVNMAQTYGVTPIVCVGEKSKDDNVMLVADQVKAALSKRINDDIIFAYEPIWAIGSGEIPTIDQIDKVLKIIRDAAEENGINIKVLYGGSVNLKNHKELRTSTADGFLMGGVSLKLDDFVSIIKGE